MPTMIASKGVFSRRAILCILAGSVASAIQVACASGPLTSVPITTPPAVPSATTGPATLASHTTKVAAVLAAPTATPNSNRAQIAVYYVNGPNGELENPYASLIQESASKLPPDRSLKVDLLPVKLDATKAGVDAEQIATSYASQIASGAVAADLVLADRVVLRALGRAHALTDLGPLLDKQAWFKRDDFWSNILQTGQIAGVQLALPIRASIEVLAYEPTLLQKHGVSNLPLDWTWEQLIPIANSVATDVKWGLRVSPYSPNVFSLAWQFGSSVIGANGSLRLTEPGTIRALELLDRLVHTEKVGLPFDPAVVGLAYNDPFIPWWEESAAVTDFGFIEDIYGLGHRTVAMLATQSTGPYEVWWRSFDNGGDHIELTSVPRGDQAAVLGNATVLLGIPVKPRNLDHSLAALESLLDASSLAAVLPPRKSAPSLRQVSKLITDTDVKVLTASLQVVRFLPGDATSTIFQQVAQELVTPVLAGKKKPQDAASDAQKLIDTAMAG